MDLALVIQNLCFSDTIQLSILVPFMKKIKLIGKNKFLVFFIRNY